MTLLKSIDKLKTGDLAPDFKLKNVDGKKYSLNSFNGTAFLIIFMCNHCPYVKAKLETIKNLSSKFESLVVIGINSNNSIDYPDDSYENMVKVAKEKNFNFYYLHDKDQTVAKAYGASCTPDPFLFDSSKKLVYHGRFDDALEPDQVTTTNDMNDAISAVLSGEKPKQDFLFSMGCSIKWK